ncbi:hypothetical protein PAESOLCIP111_03125 [Paenibacillus solanacearum]|uniref:Uncharacterized protein n=1 Tax=Paenibacillus solanacearum TaxID=2048548 RepID=A0A916K295_9BACL|nr:hypothetical protein PAESOLCIP111_03125 [Paenibacillus solanacearum]
MPKYEFRENPLNTNHTNPTLSYLRRRVQLRGRSPDLGINAVRHLPGMQHTSGKLTWATPLQWRDRAGFAPDFPIKLPVPARTRNTRAIQYVEYILKYISIYCACQWIVWHIEVMFTNICDRIDSVLRSAIPVRACADGALGDRRVPAARPPESGPPASDAKVRKAVEQCRNVRMRFARVGKTNARLNSLARTG